jgi:hypothetical protein
VFVERQSVIGCLFSAFSPIFSVLGRKAIKSGKNFSKKRIFAQKEIDFL